MPIRYNILPEIDLVFVRCLGEVAIDEYIAAFLDYAAEPQFDGRQHVLVDLSQCTLDNSYFEDMQRLAYRLKGYYGVRDPSSKTSVYAPGDVVYGMSRMYQSISDGMSPWEVGVFRTLEDAMSFVGLEDGSPVLQRVMAGRPT